MKIGRLIDHPTRHGDLDYGRHAIELVLDEAGAVAGEPITLVDLDATGSIERVLDGARRLVDDGCVLILGPAVTHFAVPLVPVLDELAVPAINWSGSALARGAWAFQLKVGSLPDEAGHLTRLLGVRGHRTIAIVRDEGPIGEEYVAFLRPGLDALGIDVVLDVAMADAAELPACVDWLHARAPACAVYLGLGPIGMSLARAMRERGVAIPLFGNVGIGVFPTADLDGVVFTDVVDETNPVLQRFLRRWDVRHDSRPALIGLAASHDLATTAVAALRRAPTPTPAGVRVGLEQLRGLPAAVGAAGTTIGFGPWDRDGYKGPLVVYREIRDGRAVVHRL
jgi:ABC-type branched-subunit amino acid transport system substrate-binding protein